MKIDYLYSLITIAIASLLAWGYYSMTGTEELKTLVAAVAFISLAISGLCSIAFTIGEPRSSIVIRFTSGIFFFFLLILNGAFTFFDFSKPLYFILNGLTLLILCVIIRSVARSKM